MRKYSIENGELTVNFAKPQYNDNGQPYDNRFYYGEKKFSILEKPYRASVEYEKRKGGTYIYSNNPEMLAPEDIGQAILRTKQLTGDINFTYDHSNHTGVPVYFGYQLLNEGETEVTVTVTNLGFQPDGEWLGQRSWSDYFNYRFELPEDYFNPDGSVNPIYVGCDYIDYTPKVRNPITVKIPSGEYIYIRVSMTADGRIIDCLTVSQAETNGIGSVCGDESFYGQFDGKTEETYKEIDAISGATLTTNGYKTAILRAFEAVKILEGGKGE